MEPTGKRFLLAVDVTGTFSMGQHILDKFASCFLDYRNLVRLVDIH